MFKRTNGYILLTLLVLTGFAGRVTNETLNSKERRFLVTSLKDSRADLTGLVKGLSDRQLDYRPGKGQLSIREHVSHIVAAEKAYNAYARKALDEGTDQDAAGTLPDTELAAQLAKRCPLPETTGVKATSRQRLEHTLDLYKEERAGAIKYIRTTTQDVRAYTTPTPAGAADVYQLYLAMSAHQARHNGQIRAIMQSPGFPKK